MDTTWLCTRKTINSLYCNKKYYLKTETKTITVLFTPCFWINTGQD